MWAWVFLVDHSGTAEARSGRRTRHFGFDHPPARAARHGLRVVHGGRNSVAMKPATDMSRPARNMRCRPSATYRGSTASAHPFRLRVQASWQCDAGQRARHDRAHRGHAAGPDAARELIERRRQAEPRPVRRRAARRAAATASAGPDPCAEDRAAAEQHRPRRECVSSIESRRIPASSARCRQSRLPGSPCGR